MNNKSNTIIVTIVALVVLLGLVYWQRQINDISQQEAIGVYNAKHTTNR